LRVSTTAFRLAGLGWLAGGSCHAALPLPGRAVSSVGRAPALHAGGRRFEPVTAHSHRFARFTGKPVSPGQAKRPQTEADSELESGRASMTVEAAQVSLLRWLRRQLAQPMPIREHLEAAVENDDPVEARRLIAAFPFSDEQRRNIEQLLQAWERGSSRP
jgi:hypothetical protein